MNVKIVRYLIALLFFLVISCESETKSIHRFYALSKNIFTGSEPKNSDFHFLHQQGIKTIISVDAVRPKVEEAKKHHLTYFHVPIGYTKLSTQQVNMVVKAIISAQKPIYIHCHHGKHRGPTVASMALIVLEDVDRDRAVNEMKKIGTSKNYKGLYETVRQFEIPNSIELENLPFPFSTAPVESFTEKMGNLDRHWDEIKKISARQWKNNPEHPDIDLAHEALQVAECFSEIIRLKSMKEKPEGFIELLNDAKKLSWVFEDLIRNKAVSKKYDIGKIKKQFDLINTNCKNCHQKYRND